MLRERVTISLFWPSTNLLLSAALAFSLLFLFDWNADSVSSLEKKLTEAESDLRQLCSLHDAHEAGHQEAQLTRLQTLSTPTMQTFLATFGFEISDEDQALMNAAKTNNREKVRIVPSEEKRATTFFLR